MNFYDVIISGAGPAGASAAYTLSQGGCKTLLLEKMQLPRHKTCGGGVSIAFLNRFFPFSCASVIERQASLFEYQFLGFSVQIPCQEGVMGTVMRERFDYHILFQSNAEVRDCCALQSYEEDDKQVIVTLHNGEKCSSRYLIAADGATSIIARKVQGEQGKRRTFIPAMEVEAYLPDQRYEAYLSGPRFIFEGPRFGYSWIFPKADHLTIGTAALHTKGSSVKRQLQRILLSIGIPLDRTKIEGHLIPLYNSRLPVSTRRVLLTGDAAGLVDPLSGEGIRPALKSGRIAAQTILSDSIGEYPARIRQTVARTYPYSKWIGNFFYSLRELCLLFGAPNPYTTQAILDTISDQGSSIGILIQALATLPYYLIIEVIALLLGIVKGQQNQARFLNTVYPGNYLSRPNP